MRLFDYAIFEMRYRIRKFHIEQRPRQGLQGKAHRPVRRSRSGRGLVPESPPVAARLKYASKCYGTIHLKLNSIKVKKM